MFIIFLLIMIEASSIGKPRIKFPKIASKPKSLPGQKIPKSPLDEVSAKSWLYYTPSTQYGYKNNTKRQIASLTKIMTSICTIEICKKYNMNISTTFFKITQWAANIKGTSADLIGNAWMSIEDLLYGLMLPSGNDAAMVLAENLGAVIYFDKAGDQSLIEEIRSIDLSEDRESVKFYMQQFILYMNEKSLKLKMYKSRFANPHGLDTVNHYSSCDDALIMSKQAMKVQKIRKIVATQAHKGTYKFYKEGKVACKFAFWTNTNKLLGQKGILGLKTGITSKAGGCLSTAFKNKDGEQGIIIVLGCISTQYRFKDTQMILDWAEEQGF